MSTSLARDQWTPTSTWEQGWSDSAWGGHTSCACGPTGEDSAGNQHCHAEDTAANNFWERVPGRAVDIGVGGDGTPWIVDEDGTVSYRDNESWQPVDGTDVEISRIAVGLRGAPWGIDTAGGIHRRNRGSGAGWEQLPGQARDIGVGADGTAWIVDSDGRVSYWDDRAWQCVDGSLERIAVAADGLPWGIDRAGEIHRRTGAPAPGADWEQVPGQGSDVGAGNGTAWHVNEDGYVFRWDGCRWRYVDGALLKAITVDPDGLAWGITDQGEIYRWVGYG